MKAAIVGAGGLGREVAALLKCEKRGNYAIISFFDDGMQKGTYINGHEVEGSLTDLANIEEDTDVFIAIGNPVFKSKILHELIDDSGKPRNTHLYFPNLIHSGVSFQNPENIFLGQGNIIQQGVILTTNIQIGSFNLLNLHVGINHDAIIGNRCTIMSGVLISGGAQIGDDVYIGTGAQIIKATLVGNKAFIGAGELVESDITV
ncbi:MAG: acetyltransferase [Bacteroidetes bacterium]|nr:acetyltransferase [Bacteroidota bacterium]